MVSHAPIGKVGIGDLKIDVLLPATRKAFLYFSELKIFKNSEWYLAGGTALALQVGHRQSVDLDFFIPQHEFKEALLERKLSATHHWVSMYRESGTLFGTFMSAKVSFIAYPFFTPSREMLTVGNLSILLPYDIAAMKIIAVSQRGRKRDFIDLYWYCTNREPLEDVIERALKQYPGKDHNAPHILKSLTYFSDAEKDPMPKLFFAATWGGVKAYFRREVPKVAKTLLKIR